MKFFFFPCFNIFLFTTKRVIYPGPLSDSDTRWADTTKILATPWPYFFYVSPNRENLWRRLNYALAKMVEDGSLDQIFQHYNDELLKKANLGSRRLIRLENPYPTPKTPLDNKKLWYNPSSLH